jgi:hypothetical protein
MHRVLETDAPFRTLCSVSWTPQSINFYLDTSYDKIRAAVYVLAVSIAVLLSRTYPRRNILFVLNFEIVCGVC